MKLATQSYTTSIVLAGGLTLVFLSPLLIRAEADGVANRQTSNAVIVLESPPRVITNADASKLLEQPRAELQGQPDHEELNRSPDEYQPNQDLPVPSPDRSLLAVTRSTSAKGLTAMRFIEKARNLLKAGEQKRLFRHWRRPSVWKPIRMFISICRKFIISSATTKRR